ncbi:hypothetical protein NKH14_17700 [Mesorhizobium sp. M1380]|uniref:hypothetical protein n=1 Tax=Mesorhizobium sp. M1380 TaxID=2957093 RepID=UPI003337787E
MKIARHILSGIISKLSDTSFGEEAHHVAAAIEKYAADHNLSVAKIVSTLARPENDDDRRYRISIEQGNALLVPAGWSQEADDDHTMRWTDDGGRSIALSADGRLTGYAGKKKVTDTFDTVSQVFAALDSMPSVDQLAAAENDDE